MRREKGDKEGVRKGTKGVRKELRKGTGGVKKETGVRKRQK